MGAICEAKSLGFNPKWERDGPLCGRKNAGRMWRSDSRRWEGQDWGDRCGPRQGSLSGQVTQRYVKAREDLGQRVIPEAALADLAQDVPVIRGDGQVTWADELPIG